MTIGPLQLVLVKFADEQRTAGIVEELKAVRKTGVIRLVDMLYVYKDMQGELQAKKASDLAEAQKAEYGLVLQGLLGMRAAHKTAGDVDKIAAAMSLSPGDFGLSSEQVQQMGQDLPNGGSAILILFEHVWAVRLKEALLNAGGQLIAQGLLSPEALALGGTTLADAVAAAQKIEDEAELAAAAETAEGRRQNRLKRSGFWLKPTRRQPPGWNRPGSPPQPRLQRVCVRRRVKCSRRTKCWSRASAKLPNARSKPSVKLPNAWNRAR